MPDGTGPGDSIHRGAWCIDLGSMHKTFIDSLPKVKNYTLEPEN